MNMSRTQEISLHVKYTAQKLTYNKNIDKQPPTPQLQF